MNEIIKHDMKDARVKLQNKTYMTIYVLETK